MKAFVIIENILHEESYIHKIYLNESEAYSECNNLNKNCLDERTKYFVEEYEVSGQSHEHETDSMTKIYNLSKYAWEQVEKNKDEAKELFKKIHEISKLIRK